MTKEDWKIVERQLSSLYGSAKMKIDGYIITVTYARMTMTRYCLAVYVNGVFKGEWLSEDCEIRRKFCNPQKRQVLSEKEKTKLIKEVGKRKFERFAKENPQKLQYTVYSPYFGSLRSLKSHILKNCTSIELLADTNE